MSNSQPVCISPRGDITVTARGIARFGEGQARSVDAEHYSYCWRPTGSLEPYLPDGFRIEFDCYKGADGTRRFVPVGGYKTLIPLAFLAGLVVLWRQGRISSATRDRYTRLHLVFQYVRRMREHLARTFDSSHDLYVRRRGQGGEIGTHLLPEDVFVDAERRRPASVDALMQEGRKLAISEGITNPKEETVIHYGFYRAARLNPRRVSDRESSALIRLALFDAAEGDIPSRKVLTQVRNRVLRWLENHRDEPTEQFNLGFFPGSSNFIKSIADQRNSAGGMLDHAMVRQAILEIGWEAYAIVGRCIEAFMRCFLGCLPQPVTRAERRLLQEMYFRRPYFGNLPLVLFLERGSFIKKAITELWDNSGDERLIGTLHHLLDLYGQLAATRRKADRRAKQKSLAPDAAGAETSINDLPEIAAEASRGRETVFDDIAEYLAERDGLDCTRCGGHWRWHLTQGFSNGALPDPVALKVKCGCELVEKPYSLPLDQLRSLAAEFKNGHR